MRAASADEFWTFSCASYGRPGVAEACLGLQDRIGADINMLLFCLWWSSTGGPLLDDARFAALLESAHHWQHAVVGPLRAARRALKPLAADGDSEEAAAFYKRVLATELEAERMEQALIAAPALSQAAGLPAGAVAGETSLEHHLARYLSSLAKPLRQEDRADLAIVIAAGDPDFPVKDIVDALCRAPGSQVL